MMDKGTMIIGIAGGTGSGKTTITRRIAEHFGDRISVICHDDYYKAHDDMPMSERVRLNYDHPDAFDTELFVRDIGRLAAGEAVDCPIYDYTVHNRSERTKRIEPAPVLIVEGILILAEPRLTELMDLRIFVDTDADVRILRRILRDVEERDRSLRSVIDQYLMTVKPMHEQFVEPSRHNADIVVPEGGRNAVALDLIVNRIGAHLASLADGETGRAAVDKACPSVI